MKPLFHSRTKHNKANLTIAFDRSIVPNIPAIVMSSTEPRVTESRYAAFQHTSFVRFWLARVLAISATQIVSVAVGWQIYDLTRNPLDLGIVGLIQFAPALLLVLVTGAIADHFGRRLIMGLSIGLEAICVAALLIFTLRGLTSPMPIFAVLFVFGIARAFLGPAGASLIANLVPTKDFPNAVAWNATAQQAATICGPVVGGLLYGFAAEAAYTTAVVAFIVSSLLCFSIPKPTQHTSTEPRSIEMLLGGFKYIWREKVVLGAISLDLFAVLLGGAVALLPVFARDILDHGPWALGMLRSAPGIGALAVSVWLAGSPLRNNAGVVMLFCVSLFGVFTILFGASTIAWLSILALVGIGAVDMFSVYVRQTLIQLWTPDHLRGRVSAVSQVFIGASNELGEFRAGTMAAIIGAGPAVIVGGVGAIAIAGLWAWLFPELRRVKHLQGRH